MLGILRITLDIGAPRRRSQMRKRHFPALTLLFAAFETWIGSASPFHIV
jgi:hypothetical protein